jgi:hypothetical protein
MTANPQDTGSSSPPPPPSSPPPSPPGGPGGQAPWEAAIESLGVITAPETHIPKVVNTPGFGLALVIFGCYIVVALLLYIFQWPGDSGPGLKFVVREILGQVVFVAVLAGLIYGIAVGFLGRPEVQPNHAANAVAAALVPVTLVKAVLLICLVIHLYRLFGWLAPLDNAALVVFLVAALGWGLRFNLRASIYLTLVSFIVAFIIYGAISGGAMGAMSEVMSAPVQEAQRLMDEVQRMVPPGAK